MDGWIQKIFPNCDILLNAAAHSRAERKQKVFKRAKTLRARKAGDSTRSREFLEHSLTHLLPLKQEWFLKKQNVIFLQTDGLTARQAGDEVKQWCEQYI